MIRVGRKPGIFFVPASNDMSHFFPSSFSCSDYVYITDDLYAKLLQFTDPKLKDFDKEDLRMLVPSVGTSISMDDVLMLPKAIEVKRIIDLNPNKGLLWQYNALSSDLKSLRRNVACFGEPDSLYVWSFLDKLLLPLQKFTVRLLNISLYFKNRKEQKDWDRYLEKVHKECSTTSTNG